MGVDVAGRDGGDPEPLGELGEAPVASPVAAPERPLQLDPEAFAAEAARPGAGRAPRPAGRPSRSRPPARAPSRAQPERQTRPSLRSSSESRPSAGGRGSRPGRGRVPACASVSRRQRLRQPVAFGDQEGEVEATDRARSRLVGDRELGADDRADPDPLAGLGELHRPADVVVVGERERLIAVLRGGARRSPRAARRRRGTSRRSGRAARRMALAASPGATEAKLKRRRAIRSRPLLEPSPAPGRLGRLAEDDDVAAIGQDQLEIPSLQGLRASTSDPRPATPRAPSRPRSPPRSAGRRLAGTNLDRARPIDLRPSHSCSTG